MLVRNDSINTSILFEEFLYTFFSPHVYSTTPPPVMPVLNCNHLYMAPHMWSGCEHTCKNTIKISNFSVTTIALSPFVQAFGRIKVSRAPSHLGAAQISLCSHRESWKKAEYLLCICLSNLGHGKHNRRRMEREVKAKVVASVWGAEFISPIPCRASCFASVDLEE